MRFGQARAFRFIDPFIVERERLRHQVSFVIRPLIDSLQLIIDYLPQTNSVNPAEMSSNSNYVTYGQQQQFPPPPQQQQQRLQQQQQQQPLGRDNILPAVLEFREETEEAFFNAITVSLDVNPVQFKLAPTYTIYMATRYSFGLLVFLSFYITSSKPWRTSDFGPPRTTGPSWCLRRGQ